MKQNTLFTALLALFTQALLSAPLLAQPVKGGFAGESQAFNDWASQVAEQFDAEWDALTDAHADISETLENQANGNDYRPLQSFFSFNMHSYWCPNNPFRLAAQSSEGQAFVDWIDGAMVEIGQAITALNQLIAKRNDILEPYHERLEATKEQILKFMSQEQSSREFEDLLSHRLTYEGDLQNTLLAIQHLSQDIEERLEDLQTRMETLSETWESFAEQGIRQTLPETTAMFAQATLDDRLTRRLFMERQYREQSTQLTSSSPSSYSTALQRAEVRSPSASSVLLMALFINSLQQIFFPWELKGESWVTTQNSF